MANKCIKVDRYRGRLCLAVISARYQAQFISALSEPLLIAFQDC